MPIAAVAAQATELKSSELQAGFQPEIYAVHVNGQSLDEVVLLRQPNGRLLARRADLTAWRLRVPARPDLLYQGEEYFDLASFTGVKLIADAAKQELTLDLPPDYFSSTDLNPVPVRTRPSRQTSSGAFANYDLLWSDSSGSRVGTGTLELGGFSPLGVATSNALFNHIGRNTQAIRLDSTLTRDFPDTMHTLTLGDSTSASGQWGRPIHYGGLSYGTNFATNPGFVTFPVPSLKGLSALPTTAELYINGTLRQNYNVPPGPFQINNLPIVTGQGEVKLVVQDLLGRQQVITQSFYASNLLLRSGLTDEANQIGYERDNYGLRSDDYGRPFAAVQRRKGFSDDFTGEARAEWVRQQQTLGLGGAWAFPNLGVLSAATAVSHSVLGRGALLSAQFQRQSDRGISLAASGQWTTADFTQLGYSAQQAAPARVVNASAGLSLQDRGSVSLSYLRQDNRGQPNSAVASGSYSRELSQTLSMTLSVFKDVSRSSGSKGLSLVLTLPLGERSSMSLNATAERHSGQAVLQYQQNLPAGTGTGYRLQAGSMSSSSSAEADFQYQNDQGNYEADAARTLGVNGWRLGASGSVAVLNGTAYAMRTLNDSFAIVQVPHFANVDVYNNNQIVSTTDASGYAKVPRLLAYQTNTLRIDPIELPLDAQVGVTEIEVVPNYRSGQWVVFPVNRSRSALVVIWQEGGKPMPVGTVVQIQGQSAEFVVAERGEVYLTGLADRNPLHLVAGQAACDLILDLPADAGPLPRLGPLVCKGVKP